MQNGEMKRIPLASIRENPQAVRSVNKQHADYMGFVDSIKQYGVMSPIVVREIPVGEGEDQLYSLVDGLHRYTGSLDAGIKDIPCHVVNMDDAKAMVIQLVGNMQKIETQPAQYSKQLYRILTLEPTLSKLGLAQRINRSTQYIDDRLSLLQLTDDLQKLVDDGKINLLNAYSLAKLPIAEQEAFKERAMTMSPSEFAPTALNRKKEIEKAKRQGRAAMPDVFVPVGYLQTVATLNAEIATPIIAKEVCEACGCVGQEAGFTAGIRWAMHLDPASVKIAEEKDRVRRAENERKKNDAKAERLKRQSAEAGMAVPA